MGNTNAIIVDTNVLIHNPNSVMTLMNDSNVLHISSAVIMELDHLKKEKEIGQDCQQALNLIDRLHKEKNERLVISTSSDFSHPALAHLDRKHPDHIIIALAHNITNANTCFDNVKLISNDTTVRLLARDLGIFEEEYQKTRVKIDNKIKTVNVPKEDIAFGTFRLSNQDDFIENEGVICMSDYDNKGGYDGGDDWKIRFTAIKKANKFVITPHDISCMGFRPYSMYANRTNWGQYIAMQQLLDDDVKLSFLIGGAGSGKTLLALSAIMEQRAKYRNIYISKPFTPLDGNDTMGYLPGSIEDKSAPWMRPMMKSLSYIGAGSDGNRKALESIREHGKLDIMPLDYIRGSSFVRDIIFIDECQNISISAIKTIITRCGEGTKLILVGDIKQIDNSKKMNMYNCGLSYAMEKMKDNYMVSRMILQESVRSPLASLADRML